MCVGQFMWNKFQTNQDGNIAISFAVTLFILLLAIGASVDNSNLYKTQEKLQSFADMGVLAAASSGLQTQAELEEVARIIVESNNSQSDLNITTSLEILPDNSVRVNVAAVQPLIIMDLFRHDAVNMMASADAPPKGTSPLNLALVLDTTQSMSGSKITALRMAANDLIDTLDNQDDKVQVSVVPFARYTRISRAFDNEPWLEIAPDVLDCFPTIDRALSVNCLDDPVFDANEELDYQCDIFVEKEECVELSYDGCVTSRHRPDHLLADFTNGRRLQGYAAGGSCSTEIQPLTTNMDEARNAINAIFPEGQTYMPAGLIWGWRSLSPNAPLTEANTADFNERKSVLVLMSDGANTQSLSGPSNPFGVNGLYHWNTDVEDANTVTSALCENIKNENILVYSIAFEVTDADTLNILQNCANNPSQFYTAANASQLSNAFEDIGEELAAVRLSN